MIVLDTHALIWWINGTPNLSKHAQAAIEHELGAEGGSILVSAITAWEIALLVDKGRLTLTMNVDDWLRSVSEIDAVTFVDIDVAMAVESTRLPSEFHKDLADRMIVSLARHFNVALITADAKITSYRHVKALW